MGIKLGTKLTNLQKQQRAQTRRMNKAAGGLVKRSSPSELQVNREKKKEREVRRQITLGRKFKRK